MVKKGINKMCEYCEPRFLHDEYEEYIDYLMNYVEDIELGNIAYTTSVLSFSQFRERKVLEEHYY